MSIAAPTVDVNAIIGRSRPDYDEVRVLRNATLLEPAVRREVTAAMDGLKKDDAIARGICLLALSRAAEAATALEDAGGTAPAKYLRAIALMESGRPSEAADLISGQVDTAPEGDHLALSIEALLRAGRSEEASKLLPKGKTGGALGNDARAHYLRGFCAELEADREAIGEHYAAALAEDPDHGPTHFRLGYNFDLDGDEDSAVEHYKKAAAVRPPSVNALMNLGVLHEDRGEYSRAIDCYKTVLEADPKHGRAALFLRDAEASLHMYYDEDYERKDDRRASVMRTPITDFELSVRSRNCLAKMGVTTLGDLVRFTEPELLSHKNFGETSLQEIKDILAQKALRLGMGREIDDPATRAFLGLDRPQEDKDAVLRRPISELELSVRSRNCMATLGVQAIGDLVAHSEGELMACKNFGQTSMNEIRQKLAEFGLMLRSEDD